MQANVLRPAQLALIVGALEMREALGAGDLAVLEPQARDPVAADGGVGAAVRRHEREAADRHARRRRAWRCGEVMATMVPITAPLGMDRWLNLHAACDCPVGRVSPRRRVRGERFSAAAAARASARPRTRGWRRWRSPARRRAARAAGARSDPTTGRSASVARTHQQCTRRPPPRTSSAPASPTSQTPSAPRSITSPVRACNSRASWPTRSPSRPSAVASAARSAACLAA